MSEVWEVAFDQRGSNSKVSELCLLAKGAYNLFGIGYTMSVMYLLDHQVKRMLISHRCLMHASEMMGKI